MAGKIQAVLFDLGEVIFRLDFSLVMRSAPKVQSLPLDDVLTLFNEWDIYRKYERGHMTSAVFAEELTKRFGVPPKNRQELWNSVIVGSVDGAESMLKAAANKLPLYALTNSNEWHFDHLKEKYPNLLGYFTQVFASHLIAARKPDPESFEISVKGMGVPAGNVLFIDDRIENIEAAQQLGIQGALCRESPKGLAAILRKHALL